jgi:hypothetical protein
MLGGAAIVASCGGDKPTANCGQPVLGVIIFAPGIDLLVRDPFGRGQAIGTSATIRGSDGTTDQTRAEDTLHLVSEANRTGTFTVTVTRPYYRDATITNVKVTPNGCFPNTTTVPVTLQLAAGAPSLRAMILLGQQFLDAPGAQAHLVTHFDANPDVSTAVTWDVNSPTLASVDANGIVTAKCTTTGGTVTVMATSLVDPSITSSVNLGVAPAASCP